MKTIRTLAIALTAVLLTCHVAFSATTSELLQQGLYAEEVEGNLDSAIKVYGQVINTRSAPPNHVAQALYRQGMCYLKIKDEAAARGALEKLVTEYASQTEIVAKALPILDDLTDFDPASLMPPGTLVYLEFGSPGRQVETVLAMLKGTPFENPLAVVGGTKSNQGNKSPGDIVGALLNPSMMAEFKKVRSSAFGITGIAANHPEMIGVLYPGKSDALRGLLLAGLGMAGKPGEAIEGLQTVILPEDMAVAYDEKIMILARPASQLTRCVQKYKGKISAPTLASSNKSFARLSKNQRQQNLLTVWATVDDAYAEMLKFLPGGQLPPQLVAANAMIDFKNVDDLTLTESVETNGVGTRLEFHLKDGHHCVAYDLIRTPNLSRTALAAVPAAAIAVTAFAMNPTLSAQADQVRAQIQNVTGLDFGREIFSNLEQITLFVLPAGPNATQESLPGQFGLVLTSRNPEQTRQVLSTLLGTIDPTAANQSGQFKIGNNGKSDLYCYVEQVNGVTLLALNRDVIAASTAAIRNQKSINTSGPLSPAVNRLAPTSSKLLLANVGGVIQLLPQLMPPPGLNEADAKKLNDNLNQLSRAATTTTLELRTEEQLNSFSLSSSLTDLPRLNEIIGPLTQISQINNRARAATAQKKLRQEKPALVMPATKAPVIDGSAEELWSAAPRQQLGQVIKSFGSGEPASAPTSPQDLSADFRALWDQDNLYLLVDVKDDQLVNDTNPDQPVTVPTGSEAIPWWYDDSVEVYLDADHSRGDSYDQHDMHLRLNWSATKPSLRCYNQNVEVELPGVEFAMVKTAEGYRTEIKLPWHAVAAKPAAGSMIGLDVHVNDDDDGNARDSKITWHDRDDTAWEQPKSFGTAELAGLVGWWKFDETTGPTAADSSGGNHHGTLVGNAKFGPGKIGGAIDLDGTGSFVRIADKSAFDITSEITMAAWVNFRSPPTDWAAIIAKGDTAWRLSTVQTERKFHAAIGKTAAESLDGLTAVNPGEWHQVTAAFGGGILRLYVDGKLEANQTRTSSINSNDFAVLIGENAEKQGRYFNGLIDDVRVYNYALPEREIKALATAP